MRRAPRPRSLGRRMAWAFLAAYAAILAALLLLLQPVLLYHGTEENSFAPDVAAHLAAAELERTPDGALGLPLDRGLGELAARNPDLWIVAERNGRSTALGRVPATAAALLRSLPPTLRSAELRLPGVARPMSEVIVTTLDLGDGEVRVIAGGLRGGGVGVGLWVRYLVLTAMVAIVPALGLLGILAVLVVVPFVLRAFHPLVAAAGAVGPDDLARRLPEAQTPRELLPVVRGFNAALDRLADAFGRQRRFIADVAHELRTPVAVLALHVETLPDSASKRDLQRGVGRLSTMVGQMLDSQRLALAERRREQACLVALAREAVADAAPLALAQGYEIAFAPAVAHAEASVDRAAVTRALANLIGNAVAHGGGNGLIEVRVTADGAIEVSDEGPGVPAEARTRIFEPFRRERWDRDGCGLGLHLVREVMRAHGGDVALVERAGPGATFRLTLPDAAVRASAPAREAAE